MFASGYFLGVFGCVFAPAYYGLIGRFTSNWQSGQFVTRKFSKILELLSRIIEFYDHTRSLKHTMKAGWWESMIIWQNY